MTWIFCILRTCSENDDCVLRFFLSSVKNYSKCCILSNLLEQISFTPVLVLIICVVIRAENNMTWIFWRPEFLKLWEMIVCSVFFLSFLLFFLFFYLFLLKNWLCSDLFLSSLQTSHFCSFFGKYENYPFFSFFDNYRFLDLFYSLFEITLFYQF